jgi:hypothetical protein
VRRTAKATRGKRVRTTDHTINRRDILLGGTTLAVASASGVGARRQIAQAQQPPAAPAKATRPNIVFILMDNLGYGEPGCYGSG